MADRPDDPGPGEDCLSSLGLLLAVALVVGVLLLLASCPAPQRCPRGPDASPTRCADAHALR